MKKTRHIMQRMSQRGIKNSIVEFLEKFGVSDGDKIVLNKKNCQTLSEMFGNFKRISDKMAEKGGYTLVSTDDLMITVYRLDSYHLQR